METEDPQRQLHFMKMALRCARIGWKYWDEVPVGAVTVRNDRIIAAGFNKPISSRDPSAHAEIIVIRRTAEKLGAYRIPDIDLYVTLEPCIMCLGAIIQARIQKLVFAAPDPKVGVFSTGIYDTVENGLNHKLEIKGGILAEEAGEMLRDFFIQRR